jgi:predicted metal-binding membrane protein
MDSRRVFFGITTIVFAASAAMTIAWCTSMSAMGEMPMPGGWMMSHMWMLMPGQTWLGATTSFVGMWVVMMVVMMLPSFTPALWRYRQGIGASTGARRGWLTAVVGLGYFLVWAVLAVMIFPLGVALAGTAMREPSLARAVPIAASATVLIAGLLQYTKWKTRQLALCREEAGHGRTRSADAGAAWRHGLCLGIHCVQSCAGLTTVMVALGVMDLRVMAVVGAAITVERLAPNGVRAARVIGVVLAAAGLSLIALAVGLGR